MINCVITDGFWQEDPQADMERLKAMGVNAAYYPKTSPEELYERAADAQLLIINKVIIGKEQMDRLPNLKYVGVAATGFNVVDLEEATKRGIVVTNVPAYSTDSVAQTVFAFILEFCQNVALHGTAVRQGDWARSPYFSFWKTPLYELARKTLGIVGLGQIGRKVAEIGHAFGMVILGSSRTPKNDLPDYVKQVPLEELLKNADVVTLHCPLTDATRGLMNDETLKLMKPTALLINTSRGPVLDEAAVAKALNEGRLAGAAVDVLSSEPPALDNPIVNAPRTVVTPHVAWATVEARARLLNVVMDNVQAFLEGKPQNVVNGCR